MSQTNSSYRLCRHHGRYRLFGYQCQKFDGMSDEGYAAISVGGKYGFIDKNGNICIKLPNQTTFVNSGFSEQLALVFISGKAGCVNKSGDFVIKAQFDSAYAFNNGIAEVEAKGKVGCINESGKFVIQPKFKSIGQFYDGRASVQSFIS